MQVTKTGADMEAFADTLYIEDAQKLRTLWANYCYARDALIATWNAAADAEPKQAQRFIAGAEIKTGAAVYAGVDGKIYPAAQASELPDVPLDTSEREAESFDLSSLTRTGVVPVQT